jgi:hypothetical protein
MVLDAPTPQDLKLKVEGNIQQGGWQPLGGVSVTVRGVGESYAQAMIKEKRD